MDTFLWRRNIEHILMRKKGYDIQIENQFMNKKYETKFEN